MSVFSLYFIPGSVQLPPGDKTKSFCWATKMDKDNLLKALAGPFVVQYK